MTLGEADLYDLQPWGGDLGWMAAEDDAIPKLSIPGLDRRGPTWLMSHPPFGPPVDRGPDPARCASTFRYRGFADSGYRILSPNPRHRPRRPAVVVRIEGIETLAPRSVAGQDVALPCLIYCRCGTLNAVPVPDEEPREQAQ